MAQAIILNGTSSSGKTTLSKTLQSLFLEKKNELWLHFQMDAFWDMVPDGVDANSTNFPNLKEAMIGSASALLKTNHKIIVDIVCASYDQLSFVDTLKMLGTEDIFTVAVTAGLEVIEEREKLRGDRKIGLAGSQYTSIHDNHTYDFTAETDQFDPNELASQIISKIES